MLSLLSYGTQGVMSYEVQPTSDQSGMCKNVLRRYTNVKRQQNM